MTCAHPGRVYYRHPYGDADCFHIVERCKDCGARTNPDWIPHAVVRDPRLLDVDPYLNSPPPDQRQGVLW